MLHIKKQAEPKSLADYRRTPDACYRGFSDQSDVRQALMSEQHYLCAYCMRRIKDADSSTIEHWISQTPPTVPGSDLNYRNMLGVCNGNRGQPLAMQTCDAHRGNTKLTVNPLEGTHIATIQYDLNGRISSTNPEIDRDLNVTLNLNSETTGLPFLRISAWRAVEAGMEKKHPNGSWTINFLQRVQKEVCDADADGRYKPFLGIIKYRLQKRIDALTHK